MKRMEALCSQGANQSLEQPPRVCGGAPITGGFQNTFG